MPVAAERTVTFPAELVPELRWHAERFAGPGERGLVFAGPKGAPVRRANFRPIWFVARSKARAPNLHFHDSRRVGGTLAAATGASLKELMARLGHSSTRAALIYQRATRDRAQAIADALGILVRHLTFINVAEFPGLRLRDLRVRSSKARDLRTGPGRLTVV